MSQQVKLNSIHTLRGLASLWVCLFHLTNGSNLITWSALRNFGANGWLGVEMFFVISGFIIPYVLYKSRYSLNDYKSFALKRLVRLEPPYLLSIAFILLLNYASSLSSLYKGAPFHIDSLQVILHLGYLISFFDYAWINPVFWTLAIEFQYYLLLGLLFPFLMKNKTTGLLLTILLILAAFGIETEKLVFRWFFLFFMGFMTFRYFTGLITKNVFFVLVAGGFVGCIYTLGSHQALAGIFSVWFILCFKYHNPVLDFLGNTSYALYLTHVPIGGRIINLGSRFASSEFSQVLVVLLALLASLVSAWLLYRFVEKPAQDWASRISYKKKEVALPCASST